MPDDPDDLEPRLDDAEDLELRPPSEEESLLWPVESAGRRRWIAWTAGVALVLVGGAVAVWRLRLRPGPPSAGVPSPIPSMAPVPTATPFPLPPLDGSDRIVRDLARTLSTHPLYALWLAQAELVRTFTAAVANVAEGESPRSHLAFLAPRTGFGVIERRSGRLTLDPRSYARYDAVGDAVASLDAAECARVYRLLEPLFESAYRELGHREGGFSKTLATALNRLLEVPLLEGEVPLVEVKKAVVVYAYADEKLEALSVPQKHLLRMGPRNARRIQEKIRAIVDVLGLPVPAATKQPGPG